MKICWLKSSITGLLETWRFTLLGWSHGNEEAFFDYGKFSIKDGSAVHFWEDKWLGTTTLQE
jgi:hypothetical protein